MSLQVIKSYLSLLEGHLVHLGFAEQQLLGSTVFTVQDDLHVRPGAGPDIAARLHRDLVLAPRTLFHLIFLL